VEARTEVARPEGHRAQGLVGGIRTQVFDSTAEGEEAVGWVHLVVGKIVRENGSGWTGLGQNTCDNSSGHTRLNESSTKDI
jgi:hypothetical protein